MMIFRKSPLFVGVEFVVFFAFFIYALDVRFHFFGRDVQTEFVFALHAFFEIGVDVYLYRIVQDRVGAAPEYHARPALCQLFYHVGLRDIDLIRHWHEVCRIKDPRQHIGRALFVVGHEFFAHRAVFCRHRNKIFVIERDIESFCQFFAELSSSASELTAYGNYFVHVFYLLVRLLKYIKSPPKIFVNSGSAKSRPKYRSLRARSVLRSRREVTKKKIYNYLSSIVM